MLFVAGLILSMELQQPSNHNPTEHAKNIEDILSSLKSLCKSEIQLFHDPKGRALLETAAEVLGALEKSFHDFILKADEAWKEEIDENFQKSSDPWD
jgi:kynureninase